MNIFVDTNIKGSGGMGTVSREFFVETLGGIFNVCIINNSIHKDYQYHDSLFFKYGWRQDIYQDFASGDVLYNLPKSNVHKNVFIMPFDACMLNPKKIKDINSSFVQVWCDSNFTLHQAEKAGINKNKLRLFRLGICNPGIVKSSEKNDGIFRFVNISGPEMFKVKGIDILIKSFLNTFGERKDVELFIKTSNKNGYDVFLHNYIKSEQQKNGLDSMNIKIISDKIEHKEVYDFLTQFDCYIQTSRAETFGLPVLEAMSVGLPIISSRYGGVLDFLNDYNSILVSGSIQKMKEDEWRGNCETFWYETDLEDLKESMLCMLKGKDEYCRKALNNVSEVQKTWNWDNSLEFNMKHIEEII